MAEHMAKEYCTENNGTALEYAAFVAGVEAAIDALLQEINAKKAENALLKLENALIQAQIEDEAEKLVETWRPASVPPKENKDVIVVLADGTYFMARYSSLSGWGFYFIDNGFQFDFSIGRKITHWMPLASLPPVPQQLKK